MSTSISDLNTAPNPQTENNEIIGEIINEMNSDSAPVNNIAPVNNVAPVENVNSHLERQLDNSTNMLANDNLYNINNELQQQQEINIESEDTVSIKDRVLNHIKDPTAVALIYLSLSTPILNRALSQNIPKLFSNTVSGAMSWVGLSLKALVAGVLFYLFKIVI